MRRAAAILGFVAVGVVVNVMVAWACEMWSPERESVNLVGGGTSLAKMGVVPRTWGAAYEGTCCTGPGITSGRAMWLLSVREDGSDAISWSEHVNAGAPADPADRRVSVRAWVWFRDAGWPWRSMRWRVARGPFHTESVFLSGRPIEPPPYPEFRLPRGLWEEKRLDLDLFSRTLHAAGAERWSLPLWPVWDGFLLNTALYAAFAAGVVLAPRHTLRGWRRRRRACEACGYPVGVSEVCTECGATLRVAGERRSV